MGFVRKPIFWLRKLTPYVDSSCLLPLDSALDAAATSAFIPFPDETFADREEGVLLEMFSNNNSTSVFPNSLEENNLRYDLNASTQLQLFGNLPAGINVDPVGHVRNDHISPLNINRPIKRSREAEDTPKQQMLQISLTNIHPDQGNMSASIPKPNLVSTGLRLSYDDDEYNSAAATARMLMHRIPALNSINEPLRAHIHRYREEIDNYVKNQEVQLAKGMKEMKQRHAAGIILAIEQGLDKKLKEKDLEIENINRKNKELVEKIKEVAAEAQSWQYRAHYNESVVNVLRNNLNNAMERGAAQHKEGCGDSEVDDAASSQFPDPLLVVREKSSEKMVCKTCRSKEVCMLLLPCRHLCLCEECESSAEACPVCRIMKSTGVRVYVS